MPFNSSSAPRRQALPQPEIFSYPGVPPDGIDSIVLNASGVPSAASGPYQGRYYLLAGTPLSKKTDGTYERFVAGSGQAVVGILYETVEFADNNPDTSNEPAAMVTRRATFDATKIVDYAAYSTQLLAWAQSSGVLCVFV